jgi:hypothetical protein
VRIEGCPKRHIDPAAYELLEFVQAANDGAWPVAGGVLDQADAFVRLRGLVNGIRARIEAENGNESR